MRRLVVICVLLLIAVLPAYSHGILRRSSPQANTVLPAVPSEVLLEFTEPVDPRFSQARVVAPDGGNVAHTTGLSDGGRRMIVTLDSRGPGIYTVRWRVLSAVDGHTASGSFSFAVRKEARQPPGGAPPGAPEAPATPPEAPAPPNAPAPPALPPVRLVVVRWLTYASALLLAGTILFDSMVFRWALNRLEPALAVLTGARAMVGLERLRTSAAIVLLTALVLEFVMQAVEVLGVGIGAALRREVVFPLLAQTRLGWSVLVRAFAGALLLLPSSASGRILRAAGLAWLVVFTAVVAFLGGPAALGTSDVALIVLVGAVYGLASVLAARIIPAIPDVRVPDTRWAGIAAAGVLLAGFTLSSHAAGGGVVLAVIDWLHLAAAATWVGGLPALLIVLRGVPSAVRPQAGRVLVARVSYLAGLSLLVMVVTGTAEAWRFVASLRGFVVSAYGRTLLLKLAVVIVLAALGALNRFILRPRIEQGSTSALDRFRWGVTVEVTLAAFILLVVASLTITPPAAVTTAPAEEESLNFAGYLGASRVQVRVTPAKPGVNEFEVSGGPVSLRVRRLEASQDVTVSLARAGTGPSSGSAEVGEGWWEVVVAAEGRTTSFPLLLGSRSRESDPTAVVLLAQARAAMRAVRTWREHEQLTDGKGNVVATQFEVVRPDRLRYRTASGSEAVIVGSERFSREAGRAWARDRLPQSISLEGPYLEYMRDVRAVRLGRVERCGGEPCRVVFWTLASGTAHFAAHVGVRSHRVYGVAMVAPAHYMTSSADALNAPLTITPPR